MLSWHGKISKNYAWEVSGLHKMQPFKDAVCFFDANVNWSRSREWDHSPRFEIYFELFNIKVFEFSIYNVNHAEYAEPIKEVDLFKALEEAAKNRPTVDGSDTFVLPQPFRIIDPKDLQK